VSVLNERVTTVLRFLFDLILMSLALSPLFLIYWFMAE
jgi:hypothetical protein